MILPALKADYLYLLVPLAALSPMLGTIEHLEAVSRGFREGHTQLYEPSESSTVLFLPTRVVDTPEF